MQELNPVYSCHEHLLILGCCQAISVTEATWRALDGRGELCGRSAIETVHR